LDPYAKGTLSPKKALTDCKFEISVFISIESTLLMYTFSPFLHSTSSLSIHGLYLDLVDGSTIFKNC